VKNWVHKYGYKESLIWHRN